MKEKENVMKERKQLSQLKGAVIRSSKKREARHYINSKYSGAGRMSLGQGLDYQERKGDKTGPTTDEGEGNT